jgi:hypothetical protein
MVMASIGLELSTIPRECAVRRNDCSLIVIGIVSLSVGQGRQSGNRAVRDIEAASDLAPQPRRCGPLTPSMGAILRAGCAPPPMVPAG